MIVVYWMYQCTCQCTTLHPFVCCCLRFFKVLPKLWMSTLQANQFNWSSRLRAARDLIMVRCPCQANRFMQRYGQPPIVSRSLSFLVHVAKEKVMSIRHRANIQALTQILLFQALASETQRRECGSCGLIKPWDMDGYGSTLGPNDIRKLKIPAIDVDLFPGILDKPENLQLQVWTSLIN